MVLLIFFSVGVAQATDIDGTTGVVFKLDQHAFADGDSATGMVYFDQGFTVPAAGTATLKTLPPVAGPIDLAGTGTLSLSGDLKLASNLEITHGGNIDGNGHTIFLDGNVTIPAGEVIRCSSDLVIDGQNHEIVMASGTPGGIIKVNGPTGTTVTLRNLTLRGLKEYGSSLRSIMFGPGAGQKIVFENVTCYLSNDMIFKGGKLDIKGNSNIKGWYAFRYQSPYDLTILSNSTLYVDMHATLKYEPSDKSRVHLVFTDKTSRLSLCGATLDVPSTIGLMLTLGNLVVDHNTIFYGHGATSLSGGIIFGNGNAAYDLYVDILPAANIDVVDGYLAYSNEE